VAALDGFNKLRDLGVASAMPRPATTVAKP